MKSICGYSNTGDTLLGYLVSKIPSYSIAVFKETCLNELLDLDYEERDYFDGEVTCMLFEFIEWADWSEWRDTMNESGIIIEEL